MKKKQLTMIEVLENSCNFIKEQLTNTSLLLINFISILAIVTIKLVIRFFYQRLLILINFFSIYFWSSIISIGILFVYFFVAIKVIKTTISFYNFIMLNSLDFALHRPMRKFEQGDDRLGFLALLFLLTGMCSLAFLFFIIPGIYFMVRASMSYPIYLEEKCSPFEAIVKSFEMTKGNFWSLLIPISINYFLIITPILNIINILFVPIVAWNNASIYTQLKNR